MILVKGGIPIRLYDFKSGRREVYAFYIASLICQVLQACTLRTSHHCTIDRSCSRDRDVFFLSSLFSELPASSFYYPSAHKPERVGYKE